MITSDAILENLQADVFAVLKNVPALADAHILADNEGDIETRVVKALGTLTETNGKRGLSIVVLRPDVTEAESNLPGPPLKLSVEIQILENVLFNRGADGTGIRTSQAALHVLAALQLFNVGALSLYAPAKNPIKEVPVKAGHVSHAVTLHAYAGGFSVLKVASIAPTLNEDDTISLDVATAGAVIYYTTDGDYPDATNGTLYADPFVTPAVGTTVRAAAYKTGLNPGDCLEFIIRDGDGNVPDGEELPDFNAIFNLALAD